MCIRDRLERVELRLPLHAESTLVRQRHGSARQLVMRDAQPLVGVPLAFEGGGGLLGVHVRRSLLEIAGNGGGELPQPLDRRLVRLEVLARPVGPFLLDELVVHKAVLRGHLRRRVRRNAPTRPVFLGKHASASCLRQQVGAQNARHAAAYDQHVGAHVAFEHPSALARTHGSRFP